MKAKRFGNIQPYQILNYLKSIQRLDRDYLSRVANMVRALSSLRKEDLQTQPFGAQIEVTTACNLKCRFCPRHAVAKNHLNKHLGYDDFVRVLDQLPKLVFLHLQGLGEPFLNKDIFRMAREARRRRIYAVTTSNLILSEETIRGIVASDFNKVNFSIESADEGTYTWFREGGSLETLERNLLLIKERKDREDRGPLIGMWCTITAANLDALESLFAFARRTEVVTSIQFQLLQEKENYLAAYDERVMAQRVSSWKEKEKAVQRTIREYGRKYGIPASLQVGRCKWPWSAVFISVEGHVLPCCHIKEYQDKAWHEVSSGNLESVFDLPAWRTLRRCLVRGDVHPSCRGCPYAT